MENSQLIIPTCILGCLVGSYCRIKGDRIHGLFSPILTNGLYIGVITHLLVEMVHSYFSNGLKAPGKCQSFRNLAAEDVENLQFPKVMLVGGSEI